MQDLKDVTNDIHYENFRAQKLAGGSFNPSKMIKVDDRFSWIVFLLISSITSFFLVCNFDCSVSVKHSSNFSYRK